MKKVNLLIILIAILIAISTIAFAQESDKTQEDMMEMGMKANKMKKHLMGGMMMKEIMEKQLVATEDGGVIVLVGNKLLKYDKDLNLVKEVEITMDFEAMEKMMEKMKEKCVMHIETMKEEPEEKKEEQEEGKEEQEEATEEQ